MCAIHNRKLELICYDHKIRICTSCALFGNHKGCDYKQEEEVAAEIGLRTDLLLEIYELVESTKQNFGDETETEELFNEFKKRQKSLKKQV